MSKTNLTDIAELYTLLASSVIEYPKDLEVECKQLPASTSISARAHRSDHGKLLGAKAKMFNAIRTLCEMAADLCGSKIHIVLNPPERGQMGYQVPFSPRSDWRTGDDSSLAQLLEDVCDWIFGTSCDWRVVCQSVSQTSSAVTLFCSQRLDEMLRQSLETWLLAAGKTRGRIVFLDFKFMDSQLENNGHHQDRRGSSHRR